MSQTRRTLLRAFGCAVALLATLVGGSTLRAALISDFVVYAQRDVFIGVGSVVTGLVGAGRSLVGDDGDTALNGTAGVVGDIRSSDDVNLGNNSFVTGTITNPGSFTVGSGVTYGAHISAMPDLPSLPPASVFAAGVTDMIVGNGATLNLAPGSYDQVSLGGAATLNLTAGDYFLRTLVAGNGLTVNVALGGGNTRLFLTDVVSIGGISAMDLTGGDALDVYVEAHGTDLLNTFRVGGGSGTQWKGKVFTPFGGIHMGSGSSGTGVVVGPLWAGGNVDLEHGLDVGMIPEPGSLTLLLIGLLALVGCRRRR